MQSPTVQFLSTLSLRRATVVYPMCFSEKINFYPRSPCGERPLPPHQQKRSNRISIHALLAESDGQNLVNGVCLIISIHALLAESDRSCQIIVIIVNNFYPRSPCGERPDKAAHCLNDKMLFLSTLSLRRATLTTVLHWYHISRISIHALLAESDNNVLPAYAACGISIHALLAESDRFSRSGRMTHRYFYPRSPCGERQY